MYGGNDIEQAKVDMISDTIEDLMNGFMKFMFEKDEARKVNIFYTYVSN